MSMTDKPSREDVLRIAKECGIIYYLTPENTREMHGADDSIERFAATMYAAGAEDMRKRAAGICHRFGDRRMHPYECEGAIRALPITTTNTEGEQDA